MSKSTVKPEDGVMLQSNVIEVFESKGDCIEPWTPSKGLKVRANVVPLRSNVGPGWMLNARVAVTSTFEVAEGVGLMMDIVTPSIEVFPGEEVGSTFTLNVLLTPK